jgi:hypothetical protein
MKEKQEHVRAVDDNPTTEDTEDRRKNPVDFQD